MSCLFKIHNMIKGSKYLQYIVISHVVIGAMHSLCYEVEIMYTFKHTSRHICLTYLFLSGLIESSEYSSPLQ